MTGNVDDIVKKIVSDTLNISVQEVNEFLLAGVNEFWDSINSINIIFALEERLAIFFEEDEISLAGNYNDLLDIVKQKVSRK